ncbi:MAG: cell filamentation protein Fic [Nitrospirae bacterium GWC2_46_6]|nr:MAG: cell filamentation protein Fic [Nitrospirae bacterium GWA2_46_11]OGW22829.1 MAG: cell filamentation protein Fic [Nitrospirae bacterium GWC2_46_6]OGW22862.1 MAG: cell filamentation protein Fic [Nitrospirae bacterium GWB2_47_37]HAK89714.1 Fic family protein [Nitrospiraceae bacterium]HCZ11426.1 Fic family protein [Nitrospiraceae bacterium]
MMTLKQLSHKPETIPAITSWYLADLGEARGKQELFTKQSPQRLNVLREHALIESAVSSSRIEGVTVDDTRVRTVVFGKSHLRDRDEEEVRGYRNALRLIHEQSAKLPVSEDIILRLHKLIRGEIWDAEKYKEKDSDIIEKYPDGRQRIRFKTVSAAKTPSFMNMLIDLWANGLREQWVHPLILLSAFNLDFLCIHPFRDGNGRVSRLLLLLQLYHLGYEVGRYISIERIIEQSKDRYYETLEQSSQGWHKGKHDPWPYINYVLYTLKTAYKEFEERVGQLKSPKGAKTELIRSAIDSFAGGFSLSDLERACPGVSRDMIRRVLRESQNLREVECLGRGPGALWRRRGNTSKRG